MGGTALPPQDAQERLELGAVIRWLLRGRARRRCRPRCFFGVESRARCRRRACVLGGLIRHGAALVCRS